MHIPNDPFFDKYNLKPVVLEPEYVVKGRRWNAAYQTGKGIALVAVVAAVTLAIFTNPLFAFTALAVCGVGVGLMVVSWIKCNQWDGKRKAAGYSDLTPAKISYVFNYANSFENAYSKLISTDSYHAFAMDDHRFGVVYWEDRQKACAISTYKTVIEKFIDEHSGN